MKFEWDDEKNRINKEKHNISFGLDNDFEGESVCRSINMRFVLFEKITSREYN